MTSRLTQKPITVLTWLCIFLTLAVAGMRVPDLSRPHRPKPRPRALLEKQEKSSESCNERIAKILALVPHHQMAEPVPVLTTTAVAVLLPPSVPALSAISCRAPPASA